MNTMSKLAKKEVSRNVERAKKCARNDALESSEDIVVVYTPKKLVEAGREFRRQHLVSQRETGRVYEMA